MTRPVMPLLLALLLTAAAAVDAQTATHPAAVTVAGSGAETWVLLSGIVGGVAGFRRLEAPLLAAGKRVIIVDPYNLSLDSAEVSFDALARRVDAILAAEGATSVHLVGHSHGGGVALRLAARDPARVAAVWLLDVGALPVNRTKTFGASLRLLPLIARFPGGRGFLRERFLRGLEKNSARHEWLDAATRRAYAEPMLDDIDRVVALAVRLAGAREPEPVAAVVARLRVPVTVVVGDVPHESGILPGEIETLRPLGALLRVEHLAGVAHFPHEEAPGEVARLLLAPSVTAPPHVAGARP